jgi:cytosine/uracil/thiamine/allantoin permease
MLWDFWVIKDRKYDTLALYQPSNRTYRFNDWLLNWRAIVAFLVGVVPSLPGLINSVNSSIDVGVGLHPYQFGWILGFVGTSIVYVALSMIFPCDESLVHRAVLADEIYDLREGNMVEGVSMGEEQGEVVRAGKEKGLSYP